MNSKTSLIIGISLPIVMLVIIIASLYLPRMLVHPKYNFLYKTDGDYDYSVENNALVKKERGYKYDRPLEEANFFIYNVATDESKKISLEEAQQLKLDSKETSPDGMKVASRSSCGVFGGCSSGYYLVGHFYSKKLELKEYSSQLLGWIIP